MYVILTTKPGQFRTELTADFEPMERYEYLFCGRKKADFTIAALAVPAPRVTIVEDGEPPLVNCIPAKFLPQFDSLEQARAELLQLAHFGSSQDISLVRQAAA